MLPLTLLLLTGSFAGTLGVGASPNPETPALGNGDRLGKEIEPRELKKLVKQVDKAIQSGGLDLAFELSSQLLSATSYGDPTRASALYFMTLVMASPQPPAHDPVLARQYLDELHSHHAGHRRSVEIQALHYWAQSLDLKDIQLGQKQGQVLERETQIGAYRRRLAQRDEELAELRRAFGEESETSSQEARVLRARLRTLTAELAELGAEIERKEAALEKLKQSLVGDPSESGR